MVDLKIKAFQLLNQRGCTNAAYKAGVYIADQGGSVTCMCDLDKYGGHSPNCKRHMVQEGYDTYMRLANPGTAPVLSKPIRYEQSGIFRKPVYEDYEMVYEDDGSEEEYQLARQDLLEAGDLTEKMRSFRIVHGIEAYNTIVGKSYE